MSCNSEYAEVWHGWAQLAALYIFTDLSVLPANTRRTFTDPSVLAANAHIVVHIAPTLLTMIIVLLSLKWGLVHL